MCVKKDRGPEKKMLPKPDARQLFVAGNTFSNCDTHENLFCLEITTSQEEYTQITDPEI